ncbi:hypothetical protein BH23VER1_BH23VER1_01550 [soil metagenome]
MGIFKRVEVWIVLILLLGLVGYVLITASKPDADSPTDPGAAAENQVPFRIVGRELTRDYGNAKLELTLIFDNRGAELQPAPPDVRLQTADGNLVDPYFLAGDFPAPIPAGRETKLTLSHWLKPEHFTQSLELCIRSDCQPVKSAAPFDIESIKNQETRSLPSADW